MRIPIQYSNILPWAAVLVLAFAVVGQMVTSADAIRNPPPTPPPPTWTPEPTTTLVVADTPTRLVIQPGVIQARLGNVAVVHLITSPHTLCDVRILRDGVLVIGLPDLSGDGYSGTGTTCNFTWFIPGDAAPGAYNVEAKAVGNKASLTAKGMIMVQP